MAFTPRSERAFSMLTFLMRACGYGLRLTRAYNRELPNWMSSAYRAVPVTLSLASMRRVLSPIGWIFFWLPFDIHCFLEDYTSRDIDQELATCCLAAFFTLSISLE